MGPAKVNSRAMRTRDRAGRRIDSSGSGWPAGGWISKVWDSDKNFRDDIANALKVGETLPLQPWALSHQEAALAKNDPEANCMPTGVPRMNPYRGLSKTARACISI